MKTREVIPIKQGLDFKLALPGSKSITNRALLCAALARGESRLYGALEADDTKVMMWALKKLGVTIRSEKDYIEVSGMGGRFLGGRKTLNLGGAGTAVRFLTAIMAIRGGETVITGDQRTRQRPIGDLVEALRQLGVEIEYLKKRSCPPLLITNTQYTMTNEEEYKVKIKVDKSSQYLSALLMLGPLLDRPLRIEVIGDLVSKSYVDTTIAVMKAFGVKIKNEKYRSFLIKPQAYRSTDYFVEGDATAASYWQSIAYLNGGKVQFLNKKFVQERNLALKSPKSVKLNKKSIQGDQTYGRMLKLLGKDEINMQNMPDSAMTLAVTAALKKGQTKITGLSTLRYKESDRLKALFAELKKLGIKVSVTKDSITVVGNPKLSIKGSKLIKTYNDHRMVMCFAVLSTKIPGIIIENPDCVSKTYPEFWEDLERAYLTPIKLGRKNLVLTGMRGSGKTYLGKKIAKKLGRKFVDLDDEIEREEGMGISGIVERHGWPYFRRIEQKICSSFDSVQDGKFKVPLVIATGGGVVLNPKNIRVLKKNGVNVFLFADPSVLVERIKSQSGRPALNCKNSVFELHEVWQERRSLYLKYVDYVWDNTSGKLLKNDLLDFLLKYCA